jgi:hypothetical protein
MTEPDYIDYTRLKTIFAYEAQWFLAVFSLRGKEFRDQSEYETCFEQKKKFAYRVLEDALDNEDIKYSCVDFPYIFDDFGNKEYNLDVIIFNIKDFLKLAMDLKYNLPDVLVAFVKGQDCNILSEEQGNQIAEDSQKFDEPQETGEAPVTEEVPAEVPPETETVPEEVEPPETIVVIESEDSPNTDESIGTVVNNSSDENNKTNNPSAQKTSQNKRRKGGPKKCTLSLAVEIVYLKLLDQGDTKVLMPGMRDAFMECFREMASDGNRNSHPGVLVLIKEVRKSKLGKYTIITHDRPNKANPKKIEEVSDEHGTSQVTRFLNSLRAKHPPIPKKLFETSS